MMTVFQKSELPMAYSMIAAARRIRPRRDGRHSFEQYFLYWAAFDSIYTAIARRQGLGTRIEEDEDGSIVTFANGNVNIPQVILVPEREKIRHALREIDDDLKHALILHEGTAYFVGRIPFWQGRGIEQDAFGQRVNGVINVGHTSDSQYPVWSPIDTRQYEGYLADPKNEEVRDFLAGQIVNLLYSVRTNLVHHGGKRLDDANDMEVIKNALPMLELIVASFTR